MDAVRGLDRSVPLLLMSYLNPLLARGRAAACRDLRRAGFSGLIVPDLPLEEAGGWIASTHSAGLDLVLLAAPTSPDVRLRAIAAARRIRLLRESRRHDGLAGRGSNRSKSDGPKAPPMDGEAAGRGIRISLRTMSARSHRPRTE